MYTVPDYVHEPLYVVTPIFNPARFKTRWKHYQRFAAMVKAAGGVLVTVEAAFGERHHALADGEDQHGAEIYQRAPTKDTEFHKARSTEAHQYLRVRTRDEIWIKENLINLGVARLPENWKYVSWIDADVAFARPNWVGETIHQLQHFKVVQMFSQSVDLLPDYSMSARPAYSFVDCYKRGVPLPTYFKGGDYYHYGSGGQGGPIQYHPGFAWAMRRDAWDELGGLIDCAILGSGDNHMAHALIGQAHRTLHPRMHPDYKDRVMEWQYRADRHIRRNVGVVSGLITHFWHGKKSLRRYKDRWRVLVDNAYHPSKDIKPDWQGLHQLVDRGCGPAADRSIRLRDQIRAYFRQRNEDSTCTE